MLKSMSPALKHGSGGRQSPVNRADSAVYGALARTDRSFRAGHEKR